MAYVGASTLIFFVKIYQLLKKLILNGHILLEEMSTCSFHTTCLMSNNSNMCFNYNGIGTFFR